MRPIVAVSCCAVKRTPRKELLGGDALGCRRRAFCLVSGIVHAQQHSPNVPSGSNCTIWGYREQRLRQNICDALRMASNFIRSKGESASDWYGGIQHFPDHTGGTWIAAKILRLTGSAATFRWSTATPSLPRNYGQGYRRIIGEPSWHQWHDFGDGKPTGTADL